MEQIEHDTRATRRYRVSRAAQLLDQVLTARLMRAEDVAHGIIVPVACIEPFRRGEMEIPLGRQLCLALLVRELVPALRREAEALRAQVNAAILFHSGETQVHEQPPASAQRWQ